MARIRLTFRQAAEKATRLAVEFKQTFPNFERYRYLITFPDRFTPQSNSTKHPVNWSVTFKLDPPPGAVLDGGELTVMVNIETNEVRLSDF